MLHIKLAQFAVRYALPPRRSESPVCAKDNKPSCVLHLLGWFIGSRGFSSLERRPEFWVLHYIHNNFIVTILILSLPIWLLKVKKEFFPVQLLWKTVQRFLKILKIELLCDPEIPLLCLHPDKSIIRKDTCISRFTATLFTIAKTWKHPTCL